MSTILDKLLAYLHRIYDKDPGAATALRIAYDGEMTWKIADGRMTTVVAGGTGGPIDLDLSAHTISSLAAEIAAEPGYSLPFVSADYGSRSALSLLDGSGNPRTQSNGDHLSVYTSLLWVLFAALARELAAAKLAIEEAIRQIHLHGAEADYLDEHGSYYGVARPGSTDVDYLNAIVSTVLMPRNNNVAIQLALARRYAANPALISVRDALGIDFGATLRLSGNWLLDGSRTLNSTPVNACAYWGRFDIVLPSDVLTTRAEVIRAIEPYRAAGTSLRDIYRCRRLLLDGTWSLDGSEQVNERLIVS